MAEYTFLLGSGVSLASGVQGVGEVTEKLFSELYFEHTDQSFIKGQHPSEYLRSYYDVKPIQDFLMLIKERADDYLFNRFGPGSKSNYEDLFDIVEQLNAEAIQSRDNVVIGEFYRDIVNASFLIRKEYRKYPEGEAADFGNFCYKTLGFIESVIKYGLHEREIRGLGVIEQLMKGEDTLNLFTLNHDLLLEKLCESLSLDYSDGFSAPDGDVRWYKPDEWDSESRIKIYKLHGSRNWYLVRHPEHGQTYAIILGNEKWHAKDGNGITIDMLSEKKHMLTGQKKSERYYSGIHGEAHFRFSSHLRACNTLIVSGYGWNDLQMNIKIFDWLYGKSENKLVLIHKDPDDMARSSRFLSYGAVPRGEKNGKIIVIKKWFEEVEGEELEGII